MKRIKIYSNYDFKRGFCCPVCGTRLYIFEKISGNKPMISPLGKLSEWLISCNHCGQEIDYLLNEK